MNPRLPLIAVLLAALVPAGLLRAQTPHLPMPRLTPSQRLASELMRTAVLRAMSEPLTLESLEMAHLLSEDALQLDPSNVLLWRIALDLAIILERDDLIGRAVEKVNALDPADERVRLMRLNIAMERHQTVESRIAAYEALLHRDNIDKLGTSVASRLAFEFALLWRRQGDHAQFANRLKQALTLDRANRAAAAVASGYFRMNVNDAFGEAELLVNLLLVDPTNIATLAALGQLLLENGAYVGAERIYRLAVRTSIAGGMAPTNALLADFAIAQWAHGDLDGALATIRKRQQDLDETVRNKARQDDPELSMLDATKLTAPVEPILATVRAAILGARGTEHRIAALADVVAAYENGIERIKTQSSQTQPEMFARYYLELAWVCAWLGQDADAVVHWLDKAQEHESLSEDARARFEGWIALRRGEPERSIQLLAPLAETDVAARAGLATALLQQNQRRDAAREFLAVNREQPGSLIGIWAADQLAALLDQRVPLSEQASKLENLIKDIPPIFDRYADQPNLVVGLRITPRSVQLDPYQPLLFDIELTNNSLFPLAIDRNGPIRPEILVAPTFRTASSPTLNEVRPCVVNIGRKLTLQPRETVSVTVDLRHHFAGELLNLVAVDGTLVRAKALVNFVATQSGAAVPSLFGREVESQLVRVDGIRANSEWIRSMLPQLKDAPASGVLERMALLSHRIASRPPIETSQEERQLIDSARIAFAEAFADLDSISQAWILSVMPAGVGPATEGLLPILNIARKSEHRIVKLAYLAFHTSGPEDPMLEAAKRGNDSTLRRMAELISVAIERATGAGANAPRR